MLPEGIRSWINHLLSGLFINFILLFSSVDFHSLLSSFTDGESKQISLDDFKAVCFHTPYCKLVQKSFGRLAFNDFLFDPSPDTSEGGKYPGLEGYR